MKRLFKIFRAAALLMALLLLALSAGCYMQPTGQGAAPSPSPSAQPEADSTEMPESRSPEPKLRATAPAKVSTPSPSPTMVVSPKPAVPKGGAFETEIVDFSKNRIKNIKLAVKKINGAVIKNGEEFSFNKTVGPRTMKKGYRDAIIFVNGEKVKEPGGGICQVSTTIYQAALKAGFDVTERHQHQREVYYVKLGDDATVYYGQLDLKFINNSGSDMTLKCWIGNGVVGVSFEAVSESA